MAFAPLPPELKQRALSIASSYKNGGSVKTPLKKAANVLEQQGRKGDTELVHVTPGELSLLEKIGSGTTNPVTGLREFFAGDQQSKDVEGRSGGFGGGDGAGRDAGNAGPAAGDPGRGDRDDRDDRDTSFEDDVADALAAGADLNSALDAAEARAGGDDDDNIATAAPDFAPNVTPPGSVPGSYSRNMVSAIQDVQDRNVVRGATDITSGRQTGTRDVRSADLGPSISAAVDSPTVSAPSPYEQLIGAPEFQTSMGAPPESTQFGEVDIPYLPSSIDVFGLEIPTGVGLIEGVLNNIFDPTGTTQQAVYDKGVRSIDGQPTGNETGLDILTGDGNVIGAYDPESNIVYSTEGNRFNPQLDDFYNQQREIDDAERERNGEGVEPILVDPTDIEEEDVAVDEEYQGQPISGLFPTSNLPDVNRELTQYTPVGDIQPFVLRPSGMKNGGIVEAARYKNGGMVQRYQDGGSVDDATKRLADLTYQAMTTGVSSSALREAERAAGLSGTDQFGRERDEFLRSAGYTPGNLQEFYGSTGGPSDPRSSALYERYTGPNVPINPETGNVTRSNVADLGYLQSQGFDVSGQVSKYAPEQQRQIRQASYQATIDPLQRQYDTLQQQFQDLMARFEESERQKNLLMGMGSGQFGETGTGTGTGINAGLGAGLQPVAAEVSPYSQLDVAPSLGGSFLQGFERIEPSYLEPVTPETNFLSDPFSPATNVGYVPPPVYYPFAYQVPGQGQTQ